MNFRSFLALTGVFALGVLTLASGCRGGARPFSRFVKVTEQPDGVVPDLDAPKQRLVTGNTDLDSTVANSKVAMAENAKSQTNRVELAMSDEDRYGKLTRRENVAKNRRVANLAQQEPDPTARKKQTTGKRDMAASKPNAKTQPQSQPASSPAKRRLTQEQYNRIMAAFKDQPEAVRREAMKRLATVMAVDAPETEQPESLSEALADRVADLPKLPAPRKRSADGNGTANRPLRRPGHPKIEDRNAEKRTPAIASNPPQKKPLTRQVATTSIGDQPSPASKTPPASKTSNQNPLVASVSRRRGAPKNPGHVERAMEPANPSPQAKPRTSSPTTASLSDLMGGELSPVAGNPVAGNPANGNVASKLSAEGRSHTDVLSAAVNAMKASVNQMANGSGVPQQGAAKVDPAVLAASALMGVPGIAPPAIDTHGFVANPPASVLEFDSEPTGDADSKSFSAATAPNTPQDVDDATKMASAQPTTTPVKPNIPDAAPANLDPTQLDDKLLYETLVKRLSTVPEGETEADRAARMIKLRHLMVLSGNPDGAVEKIDGMSESEQEYLRHQLLGLWTMVDPNGHPVHQRRLSNAISDFRQATRFASAATDALDVRSLAFCTEIESYGQIKPFEGNRFTAGQAVILYCEIDNFTAKKIETGYLTNLQGSYDIYDSDNKKVLSQLLPADEQTSANYLRDYFIAYQMHLPATLEPGTYRLQLTMEDLNAKKYGQSSIPLEISK